MTEKTFIVNDQPTDMDALDFTPYVYVQNDAATEAPSATVADSKHQREGGQGFWRGGPVAPGFRHADVLTMITDTCPPRSGAPGSIPA